MANHPNRSRANPSPSRNPKPAEILAAREAAGLTQEQAAELAMLGAQSRWAEYENGARRIDPARWALFLHRAGLSRLPWNPVSKTENEKAMIDINSAPRDGRRLILHKQNGERIVGRWGNNPGAIFRLPDEETWLADDDKFLDVPINPVIGWEPLPTWKK